MTRHFCSKALTSWLSSLVDGSWLSFSSIDVIMISVSLCDEYVLVFSPRRIPGVLNAAVLARPSIPPCTSSPLGFGLRIGERNMFCNCSGFVILFTGVHGLSISPLATLVVGAALAILFDVRMGWWAPFIDVRWAMSDDTKLTLNSWLLIVQSLCSKRHTTHVKVMITRTHVIGSQLLEVNRVKRRRNWLQKRRGKSVGSGWLYALFFLGGLPAARCDEKIRWHKRKGKQKWVCWPSDTIESVAKMGQICRWFETSVRHF